MGEIGFHAKSSGGFCYPFKMVHLSGSVPKCLRQAWQADDPGVAASISRASRASGIGSASHTPTASSSPAKTLWMSWVYVGFHADCFSHVSSYYFVCLDALQAKSEEGAGICSTLLVVFSCILIVVISIPFLVISKKNFNCL